MDGTLTLALLDEGSGVWVDATTTCTPAGALLHEAEMNRITAGTCAVGEFALLGHVEPGFFYLPMINR